MAKKVVPVLNKKINKSGQTITGCSGCGAKTCKGGGFGIYPGSEKEVVYRNLFLYISIACIIFIITYIIMNILKSVIN